MKSRITCFLEGSMYFSYEDTALYFGLWFKEHIVLNDNALSFQRASFSYTFRRLWQHCMRLTASGWCGTRFEQWILWSWAHYHVSFTVKWVSWPDAVLGGIPSVWTRYSISPLIAVLAEALRERKANPAHNKYPLWGQTNGPSRMEGDWYSHFTTN